MKKFGIRLPILCAALLLVGVTALATVVKSVSPPQMTDAHVTVTLKSETDDPVFVVTRDNATKGKKYLLVIRNGPEEADPTEENIFYMDVETATSDVVTFSNAYPMPMEDGLYRVYMTDYEKNELKQVATFDVGDSGDSGNNADNGNSGGAIGGGGGDSGNSSDGGEVRYLGDVDGNDEITMADVQMLLNIFIHNTRLEGIELRVANVDEDEDGEISMADVQMLLNMFIHNTPKQTVS